MARTQVNGGNIANNTVTEDDIALSDVTDLNVNSARHGFAPKLPWDITKYLRGDGAWATPPAGSSAPLPENTFFVSPNYNGTAPYFPSVSDVMNHIQNIQSPVAMYSIVLYQGEYGGNSTLIDYPVSIIAMGDCNFTEPFEVTTDYFEMRGRIRLSDLAIISPSIQFVNIDIMYARRMTLGNGAYGPQLQGKVRIDVIEQYNSTDSYAHIISRYIMQASIGGYGNDEIEAHVLGLAIIGGYANVSIDAGALGGLIVDDEAKVEVKNAKMVTPQSISMRAGCSLKLSNCRITTTQYCINTTSQGLLILNNTTLITNASYCMSGNDTQIFVRGGSTANVGIDPNCNFQLRNQVEFLVIEPSANMEIW